MSGDSRPLARGLAFGLACALVAGLLLAPPVAAGDNLTIFSFEPNEIDAEPGDTVTLDLVVSSHGGYSGEGIDELTTELAYDGDVFTVTEVEHGPMLATGGGDVEVDGAADIDDENGTVTMSQERVPAGDGATATDTAATITVEIADDAPRVSETLEITNASATLVSDYPQGTVERDAEIRVDGGGSDDGDETAGGNGDDSDGVTLAEESDADENADGATTEASDDPVPGFGAVTALVAIAVLLAQRGRG